MSCFYYELRIKIQETVCHPPNNKTTADSSKSVDESAAVSLESQELLFYDDRLVLRNEYLHDDPTYQVSHGADAEDDEVASWLTLETCEGES